MITLKQAREQGRLSDFVAEREAGATGDKDALNRAVASMAQTSGEAPAAWKRHRSPD